MRCGFGADGGAGLVLGEAAGEEAADAGEDEGDGHQVDGAGEY